MNMLIDPYYICEQCGLKVMKVNKHKHLWFNHHIKTNFASPKHRNRLRKQRLKNAH